MSDIAEKIRIILNHRHWSLSDLACRTDLTVQDIRDHLCLDSLQKTGPEQYVLENRDSRLSESQRYEQCLKLWKDVEAQYEKKINRMYNKIPRSERYHERQHDRKRVPFIETLSIADQENDACPDFKPATRRRTRKHPSKKKFVHRIVHYKRH